MYVKNNAKTRISLPEIVWIHLSVFKNSLIHCAKINESSHIHPNVSLIELWWNPNGLFDLPTIPSSQHREQPFQVILLHYVRPVLNEMVPNRHNWGRLTLRRIWISSKNGSNCVWTYCQPSWLHWVHLIFLISSCTGPNRTRSSTSKWEIYTWFGLLHKDLRRRSTKMCWNRSVIFPQNIPAVSVFSTVFPVEDRNRNLRYKYFLLTLQRTHTAVTVLDYIFYLNVAMEQINSMFVPINRPYSPISYWFISHQILLVLKAL